MPDNRPPISKTLTGEFLQGLSDKAPMEANAEVENKEYVQFPDKETVKAIGNSHKKGGVDVNIPDGTKILSDQLTISASQAKSISKEFDIKVSPKDTYAKVLDKYVDKIGLKRLYNEQSELFEELKTQLEGTDDKGTLNINKQYLSEKISGVEKSKEGKEKIKGLFFDTLFTIQENDKPSQNGAEDLKARKEQIFAKGGITESKFNDLIKEFNLTEKEGLYMVEYKKAMPKEYPNGGTHGEPKTKSDIQKALTAGEITQKDANLLLVEIIKGEGVKTEEDFKILKNAGAITPDEETKIQEQLNAAKGKDKDGVKFKTTTGKHKFSNREDFKREKQSRTAEGFGKITKDNIPQVLSSLYRNFPDIVAAEDVFGVTFDEDGNIQYNEDIDFSKTQKQVENFQNKANDRMKATAQVIMDNPNNFSPEQIEVAQNFVKNETFDESIARGLDSKLGQFTSGRFNMGIDIVTPDELKDLEAKNIFTVNQLKKAVDDGDVTLGESSIGRLNEISKLQGEGSDFTLNSFEGAAPVELIKPLEEEEVIVGPEGEPIIDSITELPRKKIPTRFAAPDQTPLPPSPLAAHLRGDLKLQRIDPVRVGIESQKQQADEALRFASAQMDHLPPPQRAAALAGLHANYQKSINDSIHKANVVNAQNQASASLFNIGQSGREEQAELGNALSFEQRQMTAKANTREEYLRYFDELRRINTADFRNQQDLNLLNTLTPDYDLGYSGATVDYDPTGEFRLKDRSNLVGTGLQF